MVSPLDNRALGLGNLRRFTELLPQIKDIFKLKRFKKLNRIASMAHKTSLR